MFNNIYLKDSEDTIRVGEIMGSVLISGSFVCLHGDLGAGKTHFAKGIAKGMGVVESVCSPTFTIVREYAGDFLELFHFDAYRLFGSEELEFIGFDDYLSRGGVILMEWADNVIDAVPSNRVDVFLRYADDGGRFMDVLVSDEALVKAFEGLRF